MTRSTTELTAPKKPPALSGSSSVVDDKRPSLIRPATLVAKVTHIFDLTETNRIDVLVRLNDKRRNLKLILEDIKQESFVAPPPSSASQESLQLSAKKVKQRHRDAHGFSPQVVSKLDQILVSTEAGSPGLLRADFDREKARKTAQLTKAIKDIEELEKFISIYDDHEKIYITDESKNPNETVVKSFETLLSYYPNEDIKNKFATMIKQLNELYDFSRDKPKVPDPDKVSGKLIELVRSSYRFVKEQIAQNQCKLKDQIHNALQAEINHAYNQYLSNKCLFEDDTKIVEINDIKKRLSQVAQHEARESFSLQRLESLMSSIDDQNFNKTITPNTLKKIKRDSGIYRDGSNFVEEKDRTAYKIVSAEVILLHANVADAKYGIAKTFTDHQEKFLTKIHDQYFADVKNLETAKITYLEILTNLKNAISQMPNELRFMPNEGLFRFNCCRVEDNRFIAVLSSLQTTVQRYTNSVPVNPSNKK